MAKTLTDYFNEQLIAEVVAHIPAVGPLDLCKIGLFVGNPNIRPAMVPADFTGAGVLPNFSGYATKTVTWAAAAVRLPSGLFAARGTIAAPWQPTDGLHPNTVTGAYVTDTAGANVLWAYRFATPITLNDAFDALSIVSLVGIGGTLVDDTVNT